MKTYTLKAGDISHDWFIVDAKDLPLGRLSTRVAQILRGKHKPSFTPHMDNGDFVIVVNADKIRLTGNKAETKTYFRHTGYPQGARTTTFRQAMEKDPSFVIEHAVKGMLPHTPLGRQMLKKLKVYSGTEHPHGAQQPRELKFEGLLR
ncbi:MAG: 50S ribosomal protein L13 [Calditrichaeota bacterium]|nr:50S ribosomal protein L13 [Candidatus Cloacimonadota bacterium]MCA9787399.1 50S ribosomal protein L13 [Candidatus Cloacimonadota bacterium]MCB1047150.1 50S ribosomal protein L13 [Calditrichota bacterium]MCB9472795.1 50S ribosomal protein L13 [Candidatus Delongbacteria bacterium]